MSDEKKDLRKLSAQQWVGDVSWENIKVGSLLRIADAAEKMAQRHTELMRDRDMYERWYKEGSAEVKLLRRQLSAAKGQITKLKRQIAASKGNV